MTLYQAPVRDASFILHEVLRIGQIPDLPGAGSLEPGLVTAILEEAGKLCQDVFLPLNRSGDISGCRLENGQVFTPDGFKDAYRQFTDGGWSALTADPQFGGQGMPAVIGCAVEEFTAAANMGFSLYPGLTAGVYHALAQHGSPEQRDTYLPPLAGGKWTGAMSLTEPHAGSDLGLLRTKAVANDDGSFSLSGSKIFITAGEHDLTDNIIHLVLARIDAPDTPDGIKGISMFVVPKFLPAANGAGQRNGIVCSGIEHKMGIRAAATCAITYDNATGWLVGDPHTGIKTMFTMMNKERIGVGLQGLAQSDAACQNAAAYARERLQGRAFPKPAHPDKPADPIIVHPDVRRILMRARAFNEAGRAFLLWLSLHTDLARVAKDEKTRQNSTDILALMIPVAKGVLTDRGFEHVVEAQQVFGGHGYITETGMEQFIRDTRITQIYEGTNGIQALDLVGRKLPADSGRAILAFFTQLDDECAEHKDTPEMEQFTSPLKQAANDLKAATLWLQQNAKNPNAALAGATDYMHLMGLTVLALMWTRMAAAALKNTSDDPFYKNKRTTGLYFMQHTLPETTLRLARIQAGCDTTMALPHDAF